MAKKSKKPSLKREKQELDLLLVKLLILHEAIDDYKSLIKIIKHLFKR